MKEISNSKERLIVLFSILFLLIISYIGLVIYNNRSLKEYDDKILPSTYIEEFDMSYYTYKNASEKINYIKDYVGNKKIKVNIDSKEFDYSLNDLGIDVNTEETLKVIKNSQKKQNFSSKLMMINGTKKSKYSFVYNIDEERLRNTLNNLKMTNTSDVKGSLFPFLKHQTCVVSSKTEGVTQRIVLSIKMVLMDLHLM